jgi:hypothetical protein
MVRTLKPTLMKITLKYYVILTAEYIERNEQGQFNPFKHALPEVVKRFYPTDIEYLDENETILSRKYCGELTADELLQFIEDCYFYYTIGTMGSLTLEYGHLDAISFESEAVYPDDVRLNAYISPIPENIEEIGKVYENADSGIQNSITRQMTEKLMQILDFLENDAIDADELPEYCRSFSLDTEQMELNFSE